MMASLDDSRPRSTAARSWECDAPFRSGLKPDCSDRRDNWACRAELSDQQKWQRTKTRGAEAVEPPDKSEVESGRAEIPDRAMSKSHSAHHHQ